MSERPDDTEAQATWRIALIARDGVDDGWCYGRSREEVEAFAAPLVAKGWTVDAIERREVAPWESVAQSDQQATPDEPGKGERR